MALRRDELLISAAIVEKTGRAGVEKRSWRMVAVAAAVRCSREEAHLRVALGLHDCTPRSAVPAVHGPEARQSQRLVL